MRAPAEFLDEFRSYTGFDESEDAVLGSLGPRLTAAFPRIVERFYDAIRRHPGAFRVITGGDEQVERLKETLQLWIEGLFGGVYDEAYVLRRAKIGAVHVRIGLDQRYMIFGMNTLREGILQAVEELGLDSAEERAACRAVDRICDLEIAIMLESYCDAYTDRLRRHERLAALGQLAASVGHDLRNPLAVIETSIHLVRRRTHQLIAADEGIERHFKRIGEQVDVANAILSDLLELARDRQPERRPIALSQVIDGAISSLPSEADTRLELDVPGGVRVELDVIQIRQVLVNLIQNARQAIAAVDRAEPGVVAVRAEIDGPTLELVVEDDGDGIADEALTRVFDALYTTRSKGIGLGLAICKSLVEKHGGTIVAERRQSGGARFRITLPDTVVEAMP